MNLKIDEQVPGQWLDESGDLRYPAHEAVFLLEEAFHQRAWRMSRDNLSLIDDVLQEMRMGALQHRRDHTLLFFLTRGVCRARNFLRAERRQRKWKKRYSQLSHPVMVGDASERIEALLDIQDRLERNSDFGADFAPLPERRASA